MDFLLVGAVGFLIGGFHGAAIAIVLYFGVAMLLAILDR